MPKLLIHLDWIDGYATQAPVGVWDENGACYYPEERLELKARGTSAILPSHRTWEEHLEEVTWSTYTYAANWDVCESEHPLPVVYEALWNDFLASDPPTKPLSITIPLPPEHDVESSVPEPAPSNYFPAPAQRLVNAQSWWIASELVRRHPHLLIHEMHPGGGMYDVLCVLPPIAAGFGEDVLVMLNREGTLQVHYPPSARSGVSTRVVAGWPEVLWASNPHVHVKAIEEATGWGHPIKAPASGPRTIAYRFISALLNITVNDRHRWDARNEFIDTSGHVPTPFAGGIADASQILEDLRSSPELGLPGEPESHIWALLRGGSPVAFVSTEGRFYRGAERIELLPAYRDTGRSMTQLVTRLIGDLLP